MPSTPAPLPAASTADPVAVARRIRELAAGNLGFQHFGISGVDAGPDEAHLRDWLA
ncbi:MAG: hypothetical protein LKM39_07245 [Chiayiivirga sp.]|jgi:hypothetical protein|nr:hypothetical protein [Chiayiivirga sp.]